jgi:hypothetical protein
MFQPGPNIVLAMSSCRLIGVSFMARARILKIGVPLTFIETALVGIQQRTHILVDGTERMRKLCV